MSNYYINKAVNSDDFMNQRRKVVLSQNITNNEPPDPTLLDKWVTTDNEDFSVANGVITFKNDGLFYIDAQISIRLADEQSQGSAFIYLQNSFTNKLIKTLYNTNVPKYSSLNIAAPLFMKKNEVLNIYTSGPKESIIEYNDLEHSTILYITKIY